LRLAQAHVPSSGWRTSFHGATLEESFVGRVLFDVRRVAQLEWVLRDRGFQGLILRPCGIDALVLKLKSSAHFKPTP
jgi:hypothetical protein